MLLQMRDARKAQASESPDEDSIEQHSQQSVIQKTDSTLIECKGKKLPLATSQLNTEQ